MTETNLFTEIFIKTLFMQKGDSMASGQGSDTMTLRATFTYIHQYMKDSLKLFRQNNYNFSQGMSL